MARRTIALTAEFIPGESPPLVMTAILAFLLEDRLMNGFFSPPEDALPKLLEFSLVT